MNRNGLSEHPHLGRKCEHWVPIRARTKVSRNSSLVLGIFALSIPLLYPNFASAQSCSPAAPGQVAANGCAATVPGGTFSTTAITTPVFLGQNGGSITATAPVTLTSTGDLSYGAQALTGATITMSGGSVTTNGAGANKGTPALRANGAGSAINVTNMALTTNGPGSYAVISENNAAITIHGGTVDTTNLTVHAAGLHTIGIGGTTVGSGATITADQGLIIRATDVGAFAAGGTINLDTVTIIERVAPAGNTSGLRADTDSTLGTSPGLINANNVNITMAGNGSSGVLAVGGGKVVLTNSAVSTSGTSGFGLSAAQIAPTFPGLLPVLDATNVTVTTSGIAGHGAFAFNGAIINLDTVDIQTSGDTAYGLSSEGFLFVGPPILTVLNGTNVTVHTTGPNAYGTVTDESGLMNLTDSTISTTGSNAGGVFVGDTGSVTTLLRTTVTSAQFDGGRAADSGHLFVTDSSITGARHGIRSNGGTAADPNIVSVSGGVLTATAGDAFNAHDTFSKIDVRNGTTITEGSGNLLNVISNDPATLISNVDFTTANIVNTGNIIADATSIANVNITSSSTITGIELNTFTTLDASSTWIMNGNSDIYFLSNAGLVDVTPPIGDPNLLASYKTLTTNDYVGVNGRLALNTYLGTDGAPSDILVIDGGTTTGSTSLIVRNTIGPGALTLANGILVVDTINGATSESTAFTLLGDYITDTGEQAVVGGAFAYTLNFGGVGADVDDNNWYLRSRLIPTPDPDPGPPLYQPGVPIYEVYPQNLLALNGVPTMQQRVGNRYWREPEPEPAEIFCKDPTRNFRCTVTSEQAGYYADGQAARATIEDNGIWGRLEGMHGSIEPDVTTSGTDYDTNSWKLQAGIDRLLHEADDGSKLIGGITLHYGQAFTDVSSIYGNGGIDTTGIGFGGTLTWLDQNGFYVDGQAAVTWFDSDLSSDTLGIGLADGNNGFGYALSIETGKKIDLNESWTITPQAQLIYSHVDFDTFTDPFDASVSLDNGESLRGRLGISADRDETWKDDDGKTRRSHLYGIANLYYEFLDSSQVDVSGTKFETRPERLWGGIGAGGSYNWDDDKYSVYGEVSLNSSLQNFADSYTVGGTIGFRVKW